ncbi:unnamed protein product [Heterobilharzia americana]|nr:unnamed protein product [Heterobilharzia americana]
MPLFKLILEKSYGNQRCEDIYRWPVKESLESITYEDLCNKIQQILSSKNNFNDAINTCDYLVTWYDGEDMCRISCTEELHDAAMTIAGPDGNNKSIRFYVAMGMTEVKTPGKSRKKDGASEDFQLPDLPEGLEHLDFSESPTVNQSNQENDNENQSDKETNSEPVDGAPTSEPRPETSVDSYKFKHNCATPTAPQLIASPVDPSFLPPRPDPPTLPTPIHGVKLPQAFSAYSPYTLSYYQNFQSRMVTPVLTIPPQIPSPPSTQNSIIPREVDPSMRNVLTNVYYSTHAAKQIQPKNTRLTSSMTSLPRQPNTAGKPHVDTAGIITRLRQMGFQQSDMYLNSLILHYNGNLNPILDKLYTEECRKL